MTFLRVLPQGKGAHSAWTQGVSGHAHSCGLLACALVPGTPVHVRASDEQLLPVVGEAGCDAC